MKASQTGTFMVTASAWGMSLTQNSELPQFVFQANLLAIWDEEKKEWSDYSDFEESQMAYLCLYGKKGQVLKNAEQVMKVFGWDGQSFAALASGDYSELQFQVRIEDNDPEYADNNPFQVAWIDVADATPGRSLAVLDAAGLADLDRKFAAKLKKTSGPASPKPASPKPASPKDKVATTSHTSSGTTPEEKSRRNREQKAKDDAAKETKALAKKGMPTLPKKTEGMTQEQAWAIVCNTQKEIGDGCTDEMVQEALFAAVTEVSGEDAPDVEQFTPEQWAAVVELTKKTLIGV